MDITRLIVMRVLFVLLLWAGVCILPRYLARAQVSSTWIDTQVADIDRHPSFPLDARATIQTMAHGDVVLYRRDAGSDAEGNRFGWVLAKPGETVAIRNGQLLVNGEAVRSEANLHGGYQRDAGPILVPAGTVWVGTEGHMTDSLKAGPVQAAAIKGVVSNFH